MAMALLMYYLWSIVITACSVSSKPIVERTITVDQHGDADFKTIQEAVDSVTPGTSWTLIKIHRGIYNEKVCVNKPNIVLEGEGRQRTTIQFGDSRNITTSPTIKFEADDFVARDITFKNTHNIDVDKRVTQAPAASILGDKGSFHACGFVGLQNTINDDRGRHYFHDCIIEGAIDIIKGNGQSMYENCRIKSNNFRLDDQDGYITAQGRGTKDEPTGFVFKDCSVHGSGPIWLGRNWRNYSRVVFANTHMHDIIIPQGWNATFSYESRWLSEFSEVDCRGPGADMSKRVEWMKKLSKDAIKYFTDTSAFIDKDGWLANQP